MDRRYKALLLPLLVTVLGLLLAVACDNSNSLSPTEREPLKLTPKAELTTSTDTHWTHAPDVPAPITRKEQRRVVVEWEIKELREEIAPGVTYDTYWTFEGRVPGPILRVREGDLVEIRLTNNLENLFFHNIDFHFVTGPGGGAPALRVAPGQTATIEVRATAPGLFMYHCATPDIPMHIANGMYGFVLVEPREGLPKVDKEFYVVQSEFYTKPGLTPGVVTFDPTAGDLEQPSYIVFNGKVGALTGDNALKAKVGDTVRLFVGNAGPNKISSFHVIGEILDQVYREGDLVSAPARFLQTTLIPAGGASVVELTADVPGTYLLVDHAIFRIHKGGVGQLVVEGDANTEIFEPKETPTDPVVKIDGLPKDKLSEYGIFSDLATLKPQTGVIPFEINSQLWADGALQSRFVVLPPGGKATFKEIGDWEFPEGTLLLKTVSMPVDSRDPAAGVRHIETQLLVLNAGSWEAYTYLWTADQTEADLSIAGKDVEFEQLDATGTTVKKTYHVPNLNECVLCHGQKNPRPLALSTMQLNRDVTIKGNKTRQLAHLIHLGLFSNPPQETTGFQVLEPPFGSGKLEDRARSYLHSNCAHCHSKDGRASYTGLLLDITQTDPSTIGVCKVPFSAGGGTGGLNWDILPGDGEKSIFIHRMSSLEAGVRMPELSNLQVDTEGVALIKAWIDAMTPTGCTP